jgi:hypothetical protein
MKIGGKELLDITNKAKNIKLENILTKDYPNAEIFIIREYDRFSYEDYTQDAFFEKDKAYSNMSKIPPNGSPIMCDTYQVYTETPLSLRRKPWDDVDRLIIYDKLTENYMMGSITTRDIGEMIINVD